MPDQYLKMDALKSQLFEVAKAKKDVQDVWVDDRLALLDKDVETALQACADYFKKFGYCDALAFCSDALKKDVGAMTRLLQTTAPDPNGTEDDEKSGNFMEFMYLDP